MDKLPEHSPLPSTLMSGIGVIGWETFLRNGTSVSKTWQQHQRNAASVSSQRCLRITPAVGMLHIVTLWMHADTWGMLGFKASFFGTQISSKSKTLKTATEKKPCHTENGNKIKEAKRCLGGLLPAVLQILRNHRIMREIGPQKETCQLLDIKTKVDILHPEELRASPQCSTACAC